MTQIISSPRSRPVSLGVTAIIACALLAGGGYYYLDAAHAKAPVETPAEVAVPVAVKTVKPENVRLWSSFSGRLHAVDYVDIRPEIGGRITEIRFTDGQQVKRGDTLFVIDPRPYQAAVAKAEANLNAAKINAEFAKKELDRAGDMVKTQAIAQRLYDERSSANRLATASISVAQADLETARLNLDYAFVKAPIAGKISRAEITLGNLVQPGATAPVLTSIVSSDGIYADFEIDEQTYMTNARARAHGNSEAAIPVDLTVQGDAERIYHGTIQAFDNHIDTASGTVRARAKFANDDQSLMPGMVVSIKMANSDAGQAILIPERAVSSDQNKRFVYVVGANGKVAYREVMLGSAVGDARVVSSGLNEGDRVVVDGLQHVRPDTLVAATEANTENAAEPAAGIAR